MKELIIPDCHLKPWMFRRASSIMEKGLAEQAVCLMDIADDFNKQYSLSLYRESYDEAIRFAKIYPNTIWIWGNHDLCYIWNQRETGYSKVAPWTVCEKLRELRESLVDPHNQLVYLYRVDNVLFSHGGLADEFVRQYIPKEKYNDIDSVINMINEMQRDVMWQDLSPIWYRPQYYEGKLCKSSELLQVVGHTPVKRIERRENLISTDVFSTNPDGTSFGEEDFMILDTLTWEFKTVVR